MRNRDIQFLGKSQGFRDYLPGPGDRCMGGSVVEILPTRTWGQRPARFFIRQMEGQPGEVAGRLPP